MFYYLNKHITGLFELVFPKLCAACHNRLLNDEHLVCLSCTYTLPQTNFYLQAQNTVTDVFAGKLSIKNATALYYFTKNTRVQNLIHSLKYKGRENVGVWLGNKMGKQLIESPFFCNIDLVIPVPLHPKRLKKRGFNQSACFAEGIAEIINKPVDTISLKRKINSQTQTRKSRSERWENVKDIFLTTDTDNLKGKHILLVDDVITTGATLEACAKTLLQADCSISVATIAYAEL